MACPRNCLLGDLHPQIRDTRVVEHERRKPVERAVVDRVHNREREGRSRQALISWLGRDAAWRRNDTEATVGRPNDRADGWHEMVAVRQKLHSEVRPWA